MFLRSLERLRPLSFERFFPDRHYLAAIEDFIDRSLYPKDWFPIGSALMPYLGAGFKETENSYVVSVPMPGVEEDDISVSLEGRIIKVKVESVAEEGEKTTKYNAELHLPHSIAESDIEPVYKNGLLTVIVKKPEPEEAKKIPIKVVK